MIKVLLCQTLVFRHQTVFLLFRCSEQVLYVCSLYCVVPVYFSPLNFRVSAECLCGRPEMRGMTGETRPDAEAVRD